MDTQIIGLSRSMGLPLLDVLYISQNQTIQLYGRLDNRKEVKKMKKIQKKALILLAILAVTVSMVAQHAPTVLAASVSAHVRIVGTTRTIWFGDVTTDGCTITDTAQVQHVFTQPVAICALDAASKLGNFSYQAKDFGGSLGLFLQGVAEDAGAADFSTFWLYDVNGTAASVGVASYVVNGGDSLYFHFENPNADVNARAVNDGIAYLRSQQDANGQISGFSGVSSWAAQTFVAAGINPSTVTHGGTSLLDYLQANPPTASSPATDWEKGILAITASGANPYNFGGTNYVAQLETYHTGSQLGSVTQVNDDVFGLLALVSAGTGASNTTKQDTLNFILAHQNADGGFSWSTTGTSDVDDTAAALQTLVAVQNNGVSAPTLSTAITNATNFVLAAKNSDGGFPYSKGDTSNASTTSWVVMALSALGNTGADNTNAKTYLRGNQEENGSFKWQSGSTGETFTSSYAIQALTGKFWPVKIYVGAPTPTVTPTSVPTGTPTPSPTNTPTRTVTPKPTVTPTSVPTPIVSPTPNPNPTIQDMKKQMQAQRATIVKTIQDQIQKQLEALLKLVSSLSKKK